MAQKRINDLTLRSAADDTINIPVDDATQSWRVTGAQIKAWLLGTGSVLTAMVADAAITTIKILDANVTRAKLAVGAIAPQTVVTKTTTYTLTSSDDVVLADATSAAFTLTLPSAASNSGKTFLIKKSDSSANAVTISGNLDGAARTLNKQYMAYRCFSDGSSWLINNVSGVRSQLTARVGNGYGSTNISIRRWVTANIAVIGTDLSYTDSATLGTKFNILTTGLYSISYSDSGSTSMRMGLVLNGTQGGTAIQSMTDSSVIAADFAGVANFCGFASWTGILTAGDFIWCATDTTSGSEGTARNFITIAKLD